MVCSIVVILFFILYMSIRLVSSPANANCFFYWHKTGKLGNGEGASHYLLFCCLCGDVWGGAKTSKKYRQQLRWRLFVVFNTQLHFSSLYVMTWLFTMAGWRTSDSTRVPHTPVVFGTAPHLNTDTAERLPMCYRHWTIIPPGVDTCAIVVSSVVNNFKY